ncbi:MAG: ATP-binding cassette domain-containing protein [Enterobacterales bacterium]
MSLIRINNGYLSLYNKVILKNIKLNIENNEKICLVGKNGVGKSTLLNILNKKILLDSGQIIFKKNITVSMVSQKNLYNEIIKKKDINVFQFLTEENCQKSIILKNYYETLNQIKINPNKNNIVKINNLTDKMNFYKLWEIDKTINNILIQLKINTYTKLSSLSGGLFHKIKLYKSLIFNPDILLLDEPTNHLDIITISWLENILFKFTGSIIFISHDRYFIKKLSKRIIDLDNGTLTSWSTNYENYIKYKKNLLNIEKIKKLNFNKKLEKERIWLNQGIKARRKRNEKRVRIFKEMKFNKFKYEPKKTLKQFYSHKTSDSGKIVFKIHNLTYYLKSTKIINNFNLQINRGEKIAIIGFNGCGKTTLIKLIIGIYKPHSGNIVHGTNLKISYFDQLRSTLNYNKTIIENISNGSMNIFINGLEINILKYLKNFLFDEEKSLTLVRLLSGGECNRLLLAKLFLQPSNVLILDEPTNDLDLESLEILEKCIKRYTGTLIVISHDRQFLQNVTNKYLIFDKNRQINIYNNKDYLKESILDIKNSINLKNNKKINSKYKLEKEIKRINNNIIKLEKQNKILNNQIISKNFIYQDNKLKKNMLNNIKNIENKIEIEFNKWEHLETEISKINKINKL